MMNSMVTLNTLSMLSTDMITIHPYQFGTIPATPDTFGLLQDSISGGLPAIDIFWFKAGISVPANQAVRFNLRFELNVHNSANLQIRLTPDSGTEWRWSAPIGYTGQWSKSEQQAPWFDDGMDYCINIQPSASGIAVALGEHAAVVDQPCAFIPEEHAAPEMMRSTSKDYP